MDDVAHRAGVGNATMYRHFPTRRELIVAVYAEEVTALCDRG
jgi:AcrR family transcriptional regulator